MRRVYDDVAVHSGGLARDEQNGGALWRTHAAPKMRDVAGVWLTSPRNVVLARNLIADAGPETMITREMLWFGGMLPLPASFSSIAVE